MGDRVKKQDGDQDTRIDLQPQVAEDATQMCTRRPLSPSFRLTVSGPACLEIKYPFGVYDQIFIPIRQLRGC
jgi:hypothetical protein